MIDLIATLALASTAAARAISTPTTYDYVIVGAGTSGLVLANRLSELTNITVAIIEAGDSVLNNANVSSPSGYGRAFGTAIDWAYQTTNQAAAGGVVQTIRAGKAIGGTSTINGMAYTRAEDVQIDAWEAIGNEGWSWSSLLPYYKKSQTLQKPTEAQAADGVSFDPTQNGFTGPLKTGWGSTVLTDNDIVDISNETFVELGLEWNKDVNAGKMGGFTRYPSTIDNTLNVREDAGRAYYYPVASRTNLHLYPNTFAQRIIWSQGNKTPTASGVQVLSSNASVPHTIFANAEVILSAGALASPVILELSGIGNPTILDRYNIPVVVDLPTVGENLQDQANSEMTVDTSGNTSYSGNADFVAYPTAADIFGSEIANLSTHIYNSLPAYAAEVAAASGNVTRASDLLRLFKIQHDLLFSNDHAVPMAELLIEPSGTAIHFEYWPLLPLSRGNVHIKSSVPGAAAAINPNYFLLDWDIIGHVGTSKYIRKIFGTAPFATLVGKETKPGLHVVSQNATQSQWFKWIAGAFRTNWHPVATAAMMPKEIGGVVDTSLKVYGTSNVRVVDASILPFQLCGHLTSTLYAVAERAADIVKSERQ